MTKGTSALTEKASPSAAKRLVYYEHHGRVVRREHLPQDETRLAEITDSLPKGTRTVLDVGCGVGLITRSLAQNHSVVGVDISRDVHQGATEPRVCGLATSLPFRTASFDLVLATQIFEHLTDSDLAAVSREMVRVAKRHVLITTTYRENLLEASMPCPSCGALFNAYGHLRTFDKPTLAAAVPGCSVRLTKTYAATRPYPAALINFNQKVLGFWHYELALVCTECAYDRFPSERRGRARLSRVTNAVARLLPLRRQPTRILMLFEKDSQVLG